MSNTFRSLKGVLTNSTEPQPNQNAQSFKHTTGKRIPCGLRDNKNTIDDGHDGNQVEWDSGGDRCTNETQADRTGTPYYLTRRLVPDSDSRCKYNLPRSQFRRALIGATTKTMCVGTANKPGSWMLIKRSGLDDHRIYFITLRLKVATENKSTLKTRICCCNKSTHRLIQLNA